MLICVLCLETWIPAAQHVEEEGATSEIWGKTESSAMSAPACLMCYSIRGEEIAETKGETFLVLADLRNASCGALPLWNRKSYLW